MGKARKKRKSKDAGKYTFKKAAYMILKKFKRPMSSKEMTKIILSKGYVKTDGKTPDRTLSALLYCDIRNRKESSLFCNVEKGVFSLMEFQEEAQEFNSSIHVIKDFPKIESGDEYNMEYGFAFLKYFLYATTQAARKREKVCFCCKSKKMMNHDHIEDEEEEEDDDTLVSCRRCEKCYHLKCIGFDGEVFYCPRHTCAKCEKVKKKSELVRCVTCPTTYCKRCVRSVRRKTKKLNDDLIVCTTCTPFFKEEIEHENKK